MAKTLKPKAAAPAADDYLDLVRAFPLRPIRTDAEYKAAAAVLDKLAVRDEGTLSDGEQDYLDALTMFVEAADAKADPLPRPAPHEALRALMEHREMRLADLAKLFANSKGVASEYVNGKRPITLRAAAKLAAYFRVPAAVFLPADVTGE